MGVSAKNQKKINHITDYFKKKGMDPDSLDLKTLSGTDRKQLKALQKAKGRTTRHLDIGEIEDLIRSKKS